MARKTRTSRAVPIAAPRQSNVKKVTGAKNQMKALKRLQAVTTEIEKRFKVSEKLFDEKRKLKKQLKIDPDF